MSKVTYLCPPGSKSHAPNVFALKSVVNVTCAGMSEALRTQGEQRLQLALSKGKRSLCLFLCVLLIDTLLGNKATIPLN